MAVEDKKGNRVAPLAAWTQAKGPTFATFKSFSTKERLSPVTLSPTSFAAVWILVVAVHASCATFLLACSRLYWYLEHPYLSYYADLLSPPEHRHFKAFGTMLAVLGTVHVVEFLSFLVVSARARRLAIPPLSVLAAFVRCAKWCNCRLRRMWNRDEDGDRTLSRVQSLLAHGVNLISVESSQFEIVYTVREVIDVSAQVVQCYNFSLLIARQWINRAFVALVVINCLTAGLLYRCLRRHDRTVHRMIPENVPSAPSLTPAPVSRAFARLLCLLVDCLLNVGTSIALPIAVFVPYAVQYDVEWYAFPSELLYSDTWFSNLVHENQAIFARSLWSAVYKLIPLLNIYISLMVVANLLQSRVDRGTGTRATAKVAVSPTKPMRLSIFASQFTQHQHPLVPQPARASLVYTKATAKHVKRAIVVFGFLATGFVVLVLHIRAELMNFNHIGTFATERMCSQSVYPWFASRVSCAVVQFNCYRHGVDTPPLDALDVFEPETVSSVIFTHCPALVVPPSIQTFPNLLGLEVYNSTLVEWDANAALSAEFHLNLVFLGLVYVNMTELPPGILQTPFPAKLGDIEISKTNLTTLPSTLSEVWADVELVFIEFSDFTEVPAVLLETASLTHLSLIGNKIERLPANFSTLVRTDFYVYVALCQNPIVELPEDLRPDLRFGFLSLDDTNLSEIPAWATERVDDALYLSGAPMCTAGSPITDPSIELACSQRDGGADGYYPLAVTAAMRMP